MNQKKPGRPPKLQKEIDKAIKQIEAGDYELIDDGEKEQMTKIGNFITVNTINVKGLRLNLDKVFTYAPNGDTSIQVAQGDGNSTTLNFGSKEEMLKNLDLLDSRCH